MQRKRHMVEIADAAWDKLERLASRVDAEAYLYKGRPRYGKLIELAIEKLEDSTMEWTVEEVVIEEVPAAWWDDTDAEAKPAEWDSKKGWWKGDKLDKWKPEKQWFEMSEDELEEYKKVNNASYGVSQGGPVYYGTDYAQGHDSAPSLKPIKIKPIDTDLLKETTEVVAAAMGIHLEKELDKAFVSGKAKPSDTPMLDAFKKNAATVSYTGPANPVPLVMYKTSKPGYIELTGTITQALSAPQYDILHGFAHAAFAEFSGDEGENALGVSVKSVPWNKLWISATYADPSKLLKKLPDVGEAVAKRVEAWLLQGNFIGTGVGPDQKPAYHTPIW